MNPHYQQFYTTVMDYAHKHDRSHLPWREKPTPYRVAVSEFMLQQTQVDRVIPFFTNWMKEFPNWKKLAEAPQSKVLAAWKGLGYNSRALRLHRLAQVLVNEYHGRLPRNYKKLLTLPGIGPYTAGAILAFAYNIYTPIIETNIRRVFIHHFLSDREDVHDEEIKVIMEDMGAVADAGSWYAALMDYGSELPKIFNYNPNQQSKHHSKQSKFEGSDRQIRGRILELLLGQKNNRMSRKKLFQGLGEETERYQTICEQLEKEGFIQSIKKSLILR